MSRGRRIFWQALRILVSAGLIAVLLFRVSPSRLAGELRGIDPAWIAAAVLVFLASSLLGSIQWHVLLAAGGVPIPLRRTMSLYLTGLFFNNLLPTNIGGDVFKIYDVSRSGHDPHRVFAVTLLDRVFGITGLCLLAITASAALLALGHRGPLALYLLIFIGCTTPVAVLGLSRSLSSRLRRILGGIGLWGIGRRIELVLRHIGAFRDLRELLGRITLLTLAIQFLRIASHVAVARALGIVPGPEQLLYFYVFVPLLGLIMILPISLNGLGVREGAGVLLFTRIGLLEEQAFLMEFITYVVMVAVSIAGGFIFLRRQLRR